MRIDNKRWFIVTICLPFLGFIAFFSICFLIAINRCHHDCYGAMMTLWMITAVCCNPAVVRAMECVRVRSRTFVHHEQGIYRRGEVLPDEAHELEHGDSGDTAIVMISFVLGPIITLYAMIFVVCIGEGLFGKHIVSARLFTSESSFFIACGLVCMLAHAIIVILTRRRVIKEALRVFHHRRSLQTDSV